MRQGYKESERQIERNRIRERGREEGTSAKETSKTKPSPAQLAMLSLERGQDDGKMRRSRHLNVNSIQKSAAGAAPTLRALGEEAYRREPIHELAW